MAILDNFIGSVNMLGLQVLSEKGWMAGLVRSNYTF